MLSWTSKLQEWTTSVSCDIKLWAWTMELVNDPEVRWGLPNPKRKFRFAEFWMDYKCELRHDVMSLNHGNGNDPEVRWGLLNLKKNSGLLNFEPQSWISVNLWHRSELFLNWHLGDCGRLREGMEAQGQSLQMLHSRPIDSERLLNKGCRDD